MLPLSFVISPSCRTSSAPRLKKVRRLVATVSSLNLNGFVSKTILSCSYFPFKNSVVPPKLSTHVCCHCPVVELKVLKLLPVYVCPCCVDVLVHSSSIMQLSRIKDILLSPAFFPFVAYTFHWPIQKSNCRYTGFVVHAVPCACKK